MNTNLTTILDKQNEQLHQMSKNLVLNFLQQYENSMSTSITMEKRGN